MESVQDVLRIKQDILREAPYSGGNINGKDAVFFMKEPGVDMLLYDNGTVISRDGFGQPKRPSRLGEYTKAVKRIKEMGYRPYNYFIPGVREEYELKHKDAEDTKLQAQRTFPTFQKIVLRQDKSVQERIPIRQPINQSIGRPVQMRPVPITYQPQAFSKDNNDSYLNLFKTLDDTHDIVKHKGMIKLEKIMDEKSFANWADSLYSGVTRRRGQLFKKSEVKTEKEEKEKREIAAGVSKYIKNRNRKKELKERKEREMYE